MRVKLAALKSCHRIKIKYHILCSYGLHFMNNFSFFKILLRHIVIIKFKLSLTDWFVFNIQDNFFLCIYDIMCHMY